VPHTYSTASVNASNAQNMVTVKTSIYASSSPSLERFITLRKREKTKKIRKENPNKIEAKDVNRREDNSILDR
jgi:hypothetical protein